MNKLFLTPGEIAGAAIDAGQAKAERKFLPMLILSMMAGAFIAFGAQASNMAAFNLLSNPATFGLGRILAGTVFAVGLMMVLITGAELFTGNTLICLAVYEKKTKLSAMFRNWIVVYIGNFLGSLLIVLMIMQTGLLNSGDGLLGITTVKIALNKVNLGFFSAFVSGILCNWLVCLAVWMSFAAQSIPGKIMAIFFPIWLFVTSGFEHSVANMYFIPAGIMAKAQFGAEVAGSQALNWGNFVVGNLIPVTIGNIVGGVLFVGTAFWYAYYKTSKKQ